MVRCWAAVSVQSGREGDADRPPVNVMIVCILMQFHFLYRGGNIQVSQVIINETDGSCEVGYEENVDRATYENLMQDAQVVSQYSDTVQGENMELSLDKSHIEKAVENNTDSEPESEHEHEHEPLTQKNTEPVVEPVVELDLPTTRCHSGKLDKMYADFMELGNHPIISDIWQYSQCVYPDCIISKCEEETHRAYLKRGKNTKEPRVDKHYGTYHKYHWFPAFCTTQVLRVLCSDTF